MFSKKGLFSPLVDMLLLLAAAVILYFVIAHIISKSNDETTFQACRASYVLRTGAQSGVLSLTGSDNKKAAFDAGRIPPLLCKSVDKNIDPVGKDLETEKQYVINAILKDSAKVWDEHLDGTQDNLFFATGAQSKWPCFIGATEMINAGRYFKGSNNEELAKSGAIITAEDLSNSLSSKPWMIVQTTDTCYGGAGMCVPSGAITNCGDKIPDDAVDANGRRITIETTALKFYNIVTTLGKDDPNIKNSWTEKGACTTPNTKCCITRISCVDHGGVCVDKPKEPKGLTDMDVCSKKYNNLYGAENQGSFNSPVSDLNWQCSGDKVCCVRDFQYLTYEKYIEQGPSGGFGKIAILGYIKPNSQIAIAVASPYTDSEERSTFDKTNLLSAGVGATMGSLIGSGATLGLGGPIIKIVGAGGALDAYALSDWTQTKYQDVLKSIYHQDYNTLIIGDLQTVQSFCSSEYGLEKG